MTRRFPSLLFLLLLSLSFHNTTSALADDFVDSFKAADRAGRLAERGAWSFENQTGHCVADPVLYRKFKNHGPILRWGKVFHDGTVEFRMKPAGCQRVVFTLNGDGHVFRVILMNQAATQKPAPSRVIVWAEKSSKQNKGDTLRPDGMPQLIDIDQKWVTVRLHIQGNRARLSIDDFTTTVEHAAVAREKNSVTLSFAEGELSVKEFRRSGTHESTQKMANVVGDHQLSYLLQKPAGEAPETGWPLLLFLHGYGECGEDVQLVKKHGPPKLTGEFDELKNCVIVSPQCPKNSWWRVAALKALVEEVRTTHQDIDSRRLYVSGLSMGGYGTWSLLSHYPDFFAAALPICGGGDPFRLPRNHPPIKTGITNEFLPDGLATTSTPIRVFHGKQDGAVPVLESQMLVDSLKQQNLDVQFTIYEDAGHFEAWDQAYNDINVWKWMFEQSRSVKK